MRVKDQEEILGTEAELLEEYGEEIDTAAVLAGALSGELNSDDGAQEADANTAPSQYEYRDGYGGLRLAAIWQPTQNAVTVDAPVG